MARATESIPSVSLAQYALSTVASSPFFSGFVSTLIISRYAA
jgi:hypothetical protein